MWRMPEAPLVERSQEFFDPWLVCGHPSIEALVARAVIAGERAIAAKRTRKRRDRDREAFSWPSLPGRVADAFDALAPDLIVLRKGILSGTHRDLLDGLGQLSATALAKPAVASQRAPKGQRGAVCLLSAAKREPEGSATRYEAPGPPSSAARGLIAAERLITNGPPSSSGGAIDLEELRANVLAELLAADAAEREDGDDKRRLQTAAERAQKWPDLVAVPGADPKGMLEDHLSAHGEVLSDLQADSPERIR